MCRTRGLAAVVGLLLLLAACNGEPVDDAPDEVVDEVDTPEDEDAAEPDVDETEDVATGGQLVVAVGGDAPNLDPTLTNDLIAWYVFKNSCYSLYDADENLEITPALATDLPEFSEDGRTVTIEVRDDVLFNDGTPLDAEAVKTSLDRHRTLEGSVRAGDMAMISDVDVVDDYTVEITLTDEFAPLTAMLSDRHGAIMSPAALEELGDDFGSAPVCAGPFVVTDRAPDRVVMEKSEHYYDADGVHLDGVVLQTITDTSIRFANLRTGEVQVADRMAVEDIGAVDEADDLTLHAITELGSRTLTLNVNNVDGLGEPPGDRGTPLEDPRVREAFDLAIDREAIVRVGLDDTAAPGCTPFPPTRPEAQGLDIECPQRDPERAQELLEEAGVDVPVTLDLLFAAGTESARIAELIQSTTRDAGFDVQVRSADFATSLQEAQDGQMDLYLVNFAGRLDPDGNVFIMHHTDGSLNLGSMSVPEIDELIEEARRETDPDARIELYQEIARLIVEERRVLHLHHRQAFVGTHETVEGFTLSPDGLLRFADVRLTQ